MWIFDEFLGWPNSCEFQRVCLPLPQFSKLNTQNTTIMKKTNLFAVIMMTCLFAIIMGCDNKDSIINEESYVLDDSSNGVKRSYADALAIAQGSLSMLDEPTTRSGEKRSIDESDTHYILTPKTRTTGGDSDTLLYVFNFADNGGFAVVSANAATTGLLAVTEAGNYNEVTLEKNKGLAMFMDMARLYSFGPGLDPFIEVLSTSLYAQVDPLISVTWGQYFPLGLYCPNTVAGCTNTAVAQIASYFEYPTQLQLTFAQADTASVTLDWTEIKKHTCGSYSYSTHTGCLATVEAHKNIGRFVKQFAEYARSTFWYRGNMIARGTPLQHTYTTYVGDLYDGTETSTFLPYAKDGLDSLGYLHTTVISYSYMCTKAYLDNHWPIYMRGDAWVGNTNKGHTWVVDGYRYYKDIILNHAYVDPTPTERFRYYNHINWGWFGETNGYFYDGVFSINNAFMYDQLSILGDDLNFVNLALMAIHR